MRQTAKMRAAMQGERMRYLRSLGYKSDVFPAKFRGGTCGLSGTTINIGDPVAFFQDRGLCHAFHISEAVRAEQDAKKPKCGCGRPVRHASSDVCDYCDGFIQWWFELVPTECTRESVPVLVPLAPRSLTTAERESAAESCTSYAEHR